MAITARRAAVKGCKVSIRMDVLLLVSFPAVDWRRPV
jgi:hypothetical protein